MTHLTPAWNAKDQAAEPAPELGAVNELTPDGTSWQRVSPFGVFAHDVGVQVFDREAADAIVAAFNSAAGKVQRLFRGIPTYEGHPDWPAWAKANPGVRPVAVGRLKALEVRDDGLWAQPAWNETGREMISGDAAPYEAWSPHWLMAKITYKGRTAYRPMVLRSMGLTNTPNIPGNYVGLNEALPGNSSPEMKKELLAILAALGKAPAADATDDQIVAAANEAVTTATSATSALGQVAGLQTQLTAATNEVTSVKAQLTAATNEATTVKAQILDERTQRTELLLTAAANEGKITTATRDEWKKKLIEAPDFNVVSAQIKALTPAINTQRQTSGIGPRRGEVNASTERVSAINTAVSEHMAANSNLSYDQAFDAVKKAKPALFASA